MVVWRFKLYRTFSFLGNSLRERETLVERGRKVPSSIVGPPGYPCSERPTTQVDLDVESLRSPTTSSPTTRKGSLKARRKNRRSTCMSESQIVSTTSRETFVLCGWWVDRWNLPVGLSVHEPVTTVTPRSRCQTYHCRGSGRPVRCRCTVTPSTPLYRYKTLPSRGFIYRVVEWIWISIYHV